MEQVITAFWMTIELWIFVGVLGLALVVEELITRQKARDEAYQIRINLEIDRLHR